MTDIFHLLQRHVEKMSEGNFTGPAHIRSKWAVLALDIK